MNYESGSIIRTFYKHWGCYHFGIVGTNNDVIHNVSDFPDMIVEISINGGRTWDNAPLFDYIFLKKVWDNDAGKGVIMMRQIAKGIV